MAGDWIKFEICTPDKPEVWAIAEALDIDPDAVVGKLLRVWSWFDSQSEKGNAPSVTKKLLNRLVGVNTFCECVIKAGWMREKDGVLTLPNFDRHNGKTAKNRALTAKRVAKHKGNAKVTVAALPREEKRREENKPPIPPWINADAWNEFEQHRKEMNQPLTDLARQKAMKIIEGLSHEDQAKVIDNTIQNRWKGLFPGKVKSTNGKSYDWSKNL